MHAVLKPRLDPLLRERIQAIQGMVRATTKPHSKSMQATTQSQCDYSLWFEGQKHGTVTFDYLGPSPLDCFELFEGQSRFSRLKEVTFLLL
jgi:hypothetical protein